VYHIGGYYSYCGAEVEELLDKDEQNFYHCAFDPKFDCGLQQVFVGLYLTLAFKKNPCALLEKTINAPKRKLDSLTLLADSCLGAYWELLDYDEGFLKYFIIFLLLHIVHIVGSYFAQFQI